MMNLSDIDHTVGADIGASSTGDLATVDTTMRGQQRILRRLLTNPGDYIFHPTYGAGLPSWIGRTADLPKLRALVHGQIMLEDVVARVPEPTVVVAPIANNAGGGFAVSVAYVDAFTGQPATLSFNVEA